MLFCKKHKVSFDWILAGDLRGLKEMTKDHQAARQVETQAQAQELRRLLDLVSPENYPAVLVKMWEIMGVPK